MSPSKTESTKRREEKEISFEEWKIGHEDDMSREESELNGDIDSNASKLTSSPAKGEFKMQKKKREENQNRFDEAKTGRQDDMSRVESELKGNIDSNASKLTLSPAKGESKRKKKRRDENQSSFHEGKIGRDDAMSREESELQGNVDSKAFDSPISPPMGESRKKKKRREKKQISFNEGKIGCEDDTTREESELQGNVNVDSPMSPSRGESKKKKRRREKKLNSFDGGEIGREDDISREEIESKGNIDCKASDSTMTPSKVESKRKKRRSEEKQNGFHEEKIGREDHIGREESESKGIMDSKAADSAMSPAKGDSITKKRRREEKQNGFDEDKIGREDDIGRDESDLKGNIDSNGSDLTFSPAKGESIRKKKRREENKNSFDEAKTSREEDICREESELRGNIDGNASELTLSPAKKESKRNKKRREENQNSFDEAKTGREEDISREESELKGNIDGNASESALCPAKGESKRKKKRREENQNSFDEGKIGRKDDMSREESELQGNVDSKASDLTTSPSKGESKSKKIVRFQEGAEGESKKIVRFQDGGEGDADEIVTDMPSEEDIEDDVSQERNWKKDLVSSDLRYGKFTGDEDAQIKNGVSNYLKMRGWDEKEGLQKVLHVALHPDARGCWLEIAKCLPYRPVKQINARALRLLDGSKRGKWSAEELEELENLHNQYGNDWKKISSFMNRAAQVCKDRWRHLKLAPTRKEGTWSQDEYDELCRLVRQSLRKKASLAPKTLDRREVREDINWEWIAEVMQRDSSRCAEAWYQKLASRMVSSTKWAHGDDHLLLQRLRELGAASEKTVDWDTILAHRDGELCTNRWEEMTGSLGKTGHLSFDGKLELLAHRFAPHLLGIEEEE